MSGDFSIEKRGDSTPIWRNKCLSNLDGIFSFKKPPHSVPFLNQTAKRPSDAEPFHYIPLRDLNQKHPKSLQLAQYGPDTKNGPNGSDGSKNCWAIPIRPQHSMPARGCRTAGPRRHVEPTEFSPPAPAPPQTAALLRCPLCPSSLTYTYPVLRC